MESREPLLRESNNRFTLFPIEYPDIWDAYNKMKAQFWNAEEINLSQDVIDWQQLTEQEQFFVKNIESDLMTSPCYDTVTLNNKVSFQ